MEKLEGAPLILQYIVIALLVLSLIGSAASILITLYNSFSNPYETYMGPVGLYACSGISGKKPVKSTHSVTFIKLQPLQPAR